MDHHFLPSALPTGAGYPVGDTPLASPTIFQPDPLHTQTFPSAEYDGYSNFPETGQAILPANNAQRRKRRPLGPEHTKHRRTRSGCYTCRQRRVKCDETHPICERCQKGGRECAYPGSNSSSSGRGAGGDTQVPMSPKTSSPSESEHGGNEHYQISSIAEDASEQGDSEEDDQAFGGEPIKRVESGRFGRDGVALSPTIMMEPAPNARHHRPIAPLSPSRSMGGGSSHRRASLPDDIKFYLDYHKENISYHHYFFKFDDTDFIHGTMVDIALSDTSPALLSSIVAFAAYHHSCAQKNMRQSMFLEYYNRSITALFQLVASKRHDVAALLAILQLATIEEYLGDWMNLLSHQRAAKVVLAELFTPESSVQDETRRKIVAWYCRFDITAGLMSGSHTALGRDWCTVLHEFYQQEAAVRPGDPSAFFKSCFTKTRVLAADVTILFAERKRGTISDGQFVDEYKRLLLEFATTSEVLERAFLDSAQFVPAFPRAPPPSQDDVSDFRDPRFLYAGELAPLNFVLLDFWSVELTFKYQVCLTQARAPSQECKALALKICKLFEALQYGDPGPVGGIVGAQAGLGIAALCLPSDDKHTWWLRRKFAAVEEHGYIYAQSYHTRMSDVRGTDMTDSWLPQNDETARLAASIRDFVKYRATQPKDEASFGVRDMTGFFQTMNLSPTAG
ncbi:uncharacterized protein K489DRAFT_345817 [Dissoconium aciculare CBS 342.82]|uniref:Zn(2)-C6 fungal-type domain-containing protein n=1 Tax=Dissoconium aciculare CBS 342.82 TaxID=1314786 RepID=A0A6J3LTT2_9PEZI|nr:uncharacterized protein K489DRAFT_345817 [Dissoconium aciculare CBS 342.82]KAF1819038.1 hypothetical protein K489DRAFT_345817 [Dissoconium aciculare CBS 342.82]